MPGVPGLFVEEQKAGWNKIANAIHAQGGYAYLQLWSEEYVAWRDVANKIQALWTREYSTDDRHTNRQPFRSTLG